MHNCIMCGMDCDCIAIYEKDCKLCSECQEDDDDLGLDYGEL